MCDLLYRVGPLTSAMIAAAVAKPKSGSSIRASTAARAIRARPVASMPGPSRGTRPACLTADAAFVSGVLTGMRPVGRQFAHAVPASEQAPIDERAQRTLQLRRERQRRRVVCSAASGVLLEDVIHAAKPDEVGVRARLREPG